MATAATGWGPEDRPDSTTAPRGRISGFDGIRGLAIVWVVFHNATGMPLAPASRWLHLLPLIASRGWIGVQLFFALSGFLITSGLLGTQGGPGYFRNFYAKRALRILPLYYTVLFLLLVIVPGLTTLNLPYAHESQWALWLFIANWTNSFPYGFSHFWSLAVEEQFYLLWPLVVFALVPRRLLGACLWIGLGALLLRCALAAGGADWWTFYSNTACRMDALALGGAGACVLRIPRLREMVHRRQVQIPAAALLLFVAGALLTHLYDNSTVASETVGYSFLALSCAAFVLWVAMPGGRGAPGLAALLNWSVLRSCGKYSYGIYVLHNLLHELAGRPLLTARFGKLPPLPIAFAYAVVVLVASYLLAFCSYHALEKHFIRLKRFFYSR